MQTYCDKKKRVRDCSEEELSQYRIDMDYVNSRFELLFYKKIKSHIIVDDESNINIPESYNTPTGIVYRKNRKYYAIGVTEKKGKVDSLCIDVKVHLNYTLWGPKQPEPWQYFQILKSINWRIDLYKTPRYMKRSEIALFERSRWMIFAFWGEDIDKLIQLELELMTKLMQIDRRKGGSMKKNIPKLYGLKNVRELREYITNQYKKIKFSFNAAEEEFLQKVDIADHIKYVLLETFHNP